MAGILPVHLRHVFQFLYLIPQPCRFFKFQRLGRGEQLLRTDQDSALVFADPASADCETVKAYFLELARRGIW